MTTTAAISPDTATGAAESTEAAPTVNYGALVWAEIVRRQIYPDGARERGITGKVEVRFTVGPDGHIANHALTHSSGDAELDGEVNAMMAAVAAPPPPGGRFTGAVTIYFGLR